jgi:hypothetical protein
MDEIIASVGESEGAAIWHGTAEHFYRLNALAD